MNWKVTFKHAGRCYADVPVSAPTEASALSKAVAKRIADPRQIALAVYANKIGRTYSVKRVETPSVSSGQVSNRQSDIGLPDPWSNVDPDGHDDNPPWPARRWA